uniref:lactose-binding lectin l-2-like n=1 Tax=Styela clava TaxID=7725 RepID=UPI00193A7160|nr:lactose-binding lectin l-2-like [Styela clava]
MYFTWILMILCVEISHGQRIPEQSSQDQQMHLYCTNRDQNSVTNDRRIIRGKAGPPGVVNYKIVNESIQEYINDQIHPVVEKCNEDMAELKLEIQQIREQMKEMISKSRGIEANSAETWYKARNNYRYKLFLENVSYDVAQGNCMRNGGRLASAGIRDENVRREILPLVKIGGSNTWIGLNDIQEENTFIWEDGVTATAGSILWGDHQPNSHGGNQDCVEMRGSLDWELNDEGCHIKLKYLCEIEP